MPEPGEDQQPEQPAHEPDQADGQPDAGRPLTKAERDAEKARRRGSRQAGGPGAPVST